MTTLNPDGPAHLHRSRRHRFPAWGFHERELEDGAFEYEVEHLSAPLLSDLVQLSPWTPTVTAISEGHIRIHFTRYNPAKQAGHSQ